MHIIPSAIDSEIFEFTDNVGNKRTFRLNIEHDNDHAAPWEEREGYGIVSELETRDKKPHERVLYESHGLKAFYDVKASMEIALSDGLGISGIDTSGMSKLQIATLAVEQDYQYLRAWCNDEWCYVGVIVTHIPDGADSKDVKTDYSNAFWGIESEDHDYIKQAALDLAQECSDSIKHNLAIVRGDFPEDTYHKAIYRVVNRDTGEESALYTKEECAEIIRLAEKNELKGSFCI